MRPYRTLERNAAPPSAPYAAAPGGPKPCPFCGTELYPSGSRSWYHGGNQSCILYGQSIPDGHIDRWNRRAAPQRSGSIQRIMDMSTVNANALDDYNERIRISAHHTPGGLLTANECIRIAQSVARQHGCTAVDLLRWADEANA